LEWLVMLQGAYGFCGELFMTEHEGFQTRKERQKENKNPTASGQEDQEGGYDFGEPPDLEKQRIKFNDNLTQGELYKPWKAFQHPVFGAIEIGGWVKMSSRLPAPFMLKDLVHRNASAVLFSAKNTPEISLQILETKVMGNGITRIRTRLGNARAIPSMSYQAQKNNLYPKDTLTVSGAGIKVLAGGEMTDIYNDKVTFKEFRPEIQFLFVPGFGKVEHEFLVAGNGSLTIAFQSRHAGKIVKNIDLK
jgi:hypothetical protein